MTKGFNVTYEIITRESAEHGDSAEHGFVAENVSLRHAIGELNGASVEPSCWPFDPSYPGTWFSTIDGDCDYRTGAYEYRALHMPEHLTPSTRARIARLLGVSV